MSTAARANRLVVENDKADVAMRRLRCWSCFLIVSDAACKADPLAIVWDLTGRRMDGVAGVGYVCEDTL